MDRMCIELCYPQGEQDTWEVGEMRRVLESVTSEMRNPPFTFSEYFSNHPGLRLDDTFYRHQDGRWMLGLYEYLCETLGKRKVRKLNWPDGFLKSLSRRKIKSGRSEESPA